MEREPGVAGRASRPSTRSSTSSTEARTPWSARSPWARSTWSSRSRSRPSGGSARTRTSRRCRARTRATPQLAFNLCPEELCPDAVFNPAVQELEVRQAIAYGSRPRAHQRDRGQGHRVRRQRDPAVLLQAVLHRARADLPVRPGAGEPDPRRRRWGRQRRRAAHQGRRDALVRSLRPLRVELQHPGRDAWSPRWRGDRRRVQRAGRERRQALRPDGPQGRRQAGARVRHVHLGLGRGPVRPRLPLEPPHDEGDRQSLGQLLLEPRIRRALSRSSADVRRRGAQGDHRRDDRDRCRRTWPTSSSPGIRTCRPIGPTRSRNVEPHVPGGDRRPHLRADLV